MQTERPTALRTVLFLSVADIFMGAAGLILALIVLASDATEPRALRLADMTAQCEAAGDEWSIIAEDGQIRSSINFVTWATQEGLIVRVGLYVKPEQMSCYATLAQDARDHNQALTERGSVSANLSIVWLPWTVVD